MLPGKPGGVVNLKQGSAIRSDSKGIAGILLGVSNLWLNTMLGTVFGLLHKHGCFLFALESFVLEGWDDLLWWKASPE
jgi:hypothetical protein